MNGSGISEKLRDLSGYKLIFTKHAKIRLKQRQIEKDLVIKHLRTGSALKLCEKQETEKGTEKYKLWFIPHNRLAYIYVIVINHFEQKIIVKTVIKQRLSWQRRVEKNVRKI